MPATQSGAVPHSARPFVDAGLVGAERAAALQDEERMIVLSPIAGHEAQAIAFILSGVPGAGQWDLGPMGNMSGELTRAFRQVRIDAGFVFPALMVAVGYYLAARLGLAFTLQPHPISTLWPPNALLMAALLLMPARSWWWLLAAALPAHLLAELQSGVPLAMVLGWYASNCSEALIGAALVRAFVPGAAAPGFAAQRRHLAPVRRRWSRRWPRRSSTPAWSS